MAKVLVVEDDRKLLSSLASGLEQAGYAVATAADGRDAIEKGTEQPDLAIIDLMLPGCNGFDILRAWRSTGFDGPVLVLTARDAVDDRIRGLDAGADDYMVKPFVFAELLARLRALLRRKSNQRESTFVAGELSLDSLTRRVTIAGEEIELTMREYEFLEYLIQNKNTALTRAMIARDVWKDSAGAWTNMIDVYVNRLRRKLERPNRPKLLHTIRGVGYSLKDDEC